MRDSVAATKFLFAFFQGQDNPFPAVCGAVCNRRCEDRCTRGTVDQPVAIDEIKKFLAQWELDNPQDYTVICENGEGKQWDDFKIAVIGAGPAGLSAAYYLRTEGYPVTVFEKESRPGGMLLNGIPNFLLEDLKIMKNPASNVVNEWSVYYFPHVFAEDYAAGWYDKVEAMQGKYDTYYAGEVMSFGDMDETAEYSYELVERFF